MITIIKINAIEDLQNLQRIACSCIEDVYLHSMDETIMVDVKSFLRLFTLDFEQPLKFVSESETAHKKVLKYIIKQ